MPPSAVRGAVIAPLVLAGLLAGCGTGGAPPLGGPSVLPAGPLPTDLAFESMAPTGAASPAPSTSADPTPVPTAVLSEPPEATLVGEALPGEPPVGDLGSYTWGDEGSDAPWIVSKPGVLARPGTPVSISFNPEVVPPAWTVRWAPIASGGAGDVASAAEGTGPVVFAIPDTAGAWSLQVDARFGTGRSGTWYWRVDIE